MKEEEDKEEEKCSPEHTVSLAELDFVVTL
jgi:hypothetical protein